MFSANRLNDLDKGICLILIENESGTTEVVSSSNIEETPSISPNVNALLKRMPGSELAFNLEESKLSNHLFYAFPIDFPSDSDYSGYLFVEENIGPAMAEARSILMKRLGLAMLFIMILGWIGQRFLKRILHHEVLSKRKLKDFAEIVDK